MLLIYLLVNVFKKTEKDVDVPTPNILTSNSYLTLIICK